MIDNTWKNNQWIFESTFPNGTKKGIVILFLIFLIILFIILKYPYTIYKTFYGIVEENGKNIIKFIVPLSDLEEFQSAIKQNDNLHLEKIGSTIIDDTKGALIPIYVTVPLSKKQLVQSNVIPIKLKIKTLHFFEEQLERWKKGIKK